MLQRNLLCIDFVEQIYPHWKFCATKCSWLLSLLHIVSRCERHCVCAPMERVCVCWVCVSFIMGRNKTEQNTLKHLCFGAACKSSLLPEERAKWFMHFVLPMCHIVERVELCIVCGRNAHRGAHIDKDLHSHSNRRVLADRICDWHGRSDSMVTEMQIRPAYIEGISPIHF